MTTRIIVNTLRSSPQETRNYMWADILESDVILDDDNNILGLIWDAPDDVKANSQVDRLCSGFIGARVALTVEDEADAIEDIKVMAQLLHNKG